jgi:uncharacterized protein YwqG
MPASTKGNTAVHRVTFIIHERLEGMAESHRYSDQSEDWVPLYAIAAMACRALNQLNGYPLEPLLAFLVHDASKMGYTFEYSICSTSEATRCASRRCRDSLRAMAEAAKMFVEARAALDELQSANRS